MHITGITLNHETDQRAISMVISEHVHRKAIYIQITKIMCLN